MLSIEMNSICCLKHKNTKHKISTKGKGMPKKTSKNINDGHKYCQLTIIGLDGKKS